MRVSNTFSQWVISLAVAVALLGAPVLPAVASATADDAMHAAHGSASVAGRAGVTAMHADHGKTTKVVEQVDNNPLSSSCYQQDQCSGKCCATCAQCFTVTFVLPVASVHSHAVQSPIVLRLHDRLVAAVHNRPPAA